jgi:hypothetical protein
MNHTIKMYTIATTEQGSNLTIRTYYQEDRALEYASKHIGYIFRKPQTSEQLKEYIDAYYEFVNVEMDNVSDYDITCKVENLEGLN